MNAKNKKQKLLTIEDARSLPFIDPSELASGNKIQFVVKDDRLFKAGEIFTLVDHPTSWQANFKSELTGKVHKMGMNGMKGMVII